MGGSFVGGVLVVAGLLFLAVGVVRSTTGLVGVVWMATVHVWRVSVWMETVRVGHGGEGSV
jgi:hypothetical protein